MDGHGRRVLDIFPETLRQKTGLFVGGQEDMQELERALAGPADDPVVEEGNAEDQDEDEEGEVDGDEAAAAAAAAGAAAA